MNNLKIVSWNIAGGKRINSLKQWDYSDEDLNYFSNEINKLDPDIVCLQETLVSNKRNQVEQLSKLTNLKYLENQVMSPDHINPEDEICCSILSKYEIKNYQSIVQPYPDFELRFKDGREAKKFDKYFMKFEVNGIKLLNTQLQPLHYWNHKYTEALGLTYAKQLEQVIIENSSTPLVICGDFQFGELSSVMPELFTKFQLKEMLPDKFTRIRENGNNTKSDHIIASPELQLIKSEIIETNTDHYLCFAEFEY